MGVNQKMPRTPAVFEKKCKWRSYDGETAAADSFRSNYPGAAENADVIEAQFEDEAKVGAMLKMELEEASRIYGAQLRVASLGAIQKADESFRVVHDGTHGIGVNGNIKVRDQLACPSAGELRQVLQVLEKPTFVLTADIKRAHRLVKVKVEDWGLQACRALEDASHVWLNS